jgi:Zn-finger protein
MVWSCERCRVIHRSDVTQKILDILMEEDGSEENLKKSWDRIIEPLL